MTTYIFQGNPDLFDIEGYLALGREKIVWLVNQSYKEIDIGDQVLIWKARGRGRYGPAGILAECVVDSQVLELPEDEFAIPFWRIQQDPNALRRRVWLQVIRIAESGRILNRDTIRVTPGLAEVGPIGYANATNFKLTDEAGSQLIKLWRAFSNVRSELQTRQEFDRQVAVWERVPFEQLMNEYNRARAIDSKVPKRTLVTVEIFERDPLVKAIARRRAGFRCEVPGCPTPSFPSKFAEPYCEVHHLIPLAENGEDTIENVVCVCVCANHHRELHFGKEYKALAESLQLIHA
jgi:5-methylcytosine-specific restriction endonuclease McrA